MFGHDHGWSNEQNGSPRKQAVKVACFRCFWLAVSLLLGLQVACEKVFRVGY